MKYCSSLLLFLLFHLMLMGQDHPKVLVINPNDVTELNAKNNVLKWNMFGFGRGDFSFYWEHRLNKSFTFELGLGVTKFDHYYGLWNENLGYLEDDDLTGIFGMVTSSSVRIYAEDALEGWFFDLGFKYRIYNNDQVVYRSFEYNHLELRRTAFFPRISFGFMHVVNKYGIEPFAGIGMEFLNASPTNDPSSDFTYSRKVLRIHGGLKINLLF